MSKAKSKLSPWPYIRNNRVRTTALIISLSVFMLMIYVTNYIIGGIDEPFRKADVDPFGRLQILSSDLGLNSEDYESGEEFLTDAWKVAETACEKIAAQEGVIDCKPFAWQYVMLNSVIGSSSIDCYLFGDTKDCEEFLAHMDGKLLSGRMPEKAGEIVVEKKLLNNHRNDNNLLSYLGSKYEVVGSVESDYYLAFGITQPGENDICELIMMEEGSTLDGAEACRKAGYDPQYFSNQEKALKAHKDSLGSMDIVQTILTSVSGALLLICVAVVLSLHIMDRHNEWCLFHSIGFSTGEIYVMALKEILICIGIALVVGSVLSWLTVFCLNVFLYEPVGVAIKLWRPDAVPRILAVFLALIGIAQIPIWNGMRKIQTIDTIES